MHSLPHIRSHPPTPTPMQARAHVASMIVILPQLILTQLVLIQIKNQEVRTCIAHMLQISG